jgi:hypothetical protein
MSLWTVRLTAGELMTAAAANISSDFTPAGLLPERFWIAICRPFKARAGLISGIELIWANGELDGFVSQIIDKIASSH